CHRTHGRLGAGLRLPRRVDQRCGTRVHRNRYDREDADPDPTGRQTAVEPAAARPSDRRRRGHQLPRIERCPRHQRPGPAGVRTGHGGCRMAASLLPVDARALLKTLPVGPKTSSELPDRTIDRSVALEPVAYSGFAHVVGQTLDDTVHPVYLHILGFPLSMQLLADPEVPLPMLGMVHIHNRVDMLGSVRLGEVVDFHLELDGAFDHTKGTTIEIRVDARVDGRPVMSEVSTYLAKGRKLPGAKPRAQ